MATADFHHKHDVDQYYSSSSSGGQTSITRFLTAGAISTTLADRLVRVYFSRAGTVMALILTTPLLVFFSPILVPAAIVTLLIAAGFVFSGGCGVAAITLLTWLYKYVSNYVSTVRRDYTYGGSYAQLGL